MNVPAIGLLIWFGLTATAAAQGTPSKAQMSEIRSHVNELEGRTEKLRDLNAQYRSLVEQRPAKADEEHHAKWSAALERLLRRVDTARAAVVETTQQLDKSTNGQTLPTALGKDVANTRNEAEAQRTAAEQALAKSKSTRGSKPPTKTAATEKPAPPIPDDL